jgi:hypothetical protein
LLPLKFSNKPYPLKHHRDSSEDRAFPKYGQHSLETGEMHYLEKDIMQQESTGSSLPTISANIDECMAVTQWDSTTCRQESPGAIMV